MEQKTRLSLTPPCYQKQFSPSTVALEACYQQLYGEEPTYNDDYQNQAGGLDHSCWPFAQHPICKSVSTNPRPFHLTFWSTTRSVVAKKDVILRPPAVARRAALARAQSPNAPDGTMAVRVLPMPREPPIVPPLVWKQYLLSMEGLWTRSNTSCRCEMGWSSAGERAIL